MRFIPALADVMSAESILFFAARKQHDGKQNEYTQWNEGNHDVPA